MTKKFYYLWASQILSQVTVNVMNFLLLTRLFTVTGSSIATSLLWISYALPAIFIGPIGAASVDFVDRRKMLMITNLLQAVIVFVYIFTHQSSIFLLYFVVIAYSFLNQFYIPAEAASLPSVVPKEHLARANSLFFITQQVTLVAGFGFAGVIQRLIGFSGSLIVCSTFLFIAFLSVTFLPKLKTGRKVPKAFDKIIIKFFGSILEGYRYIKSNKQILFPLMLLLGIQVSLAIAIVNLPAIGIEILKVPINYAGLLVVVPAGIGATLGSFYFPRLLKGGMRKKKLIEISLAILGASLLGIVFLIPHLTTALRVIVNPLLVILTGMGFVGVNIPTLTFLQEVTPLELRGRVFGNMWFLVTVITIFPVLFSGAISEFFGVRTLLVLMSLIAITAFFLVRKKGEEWIQNSYQ